MKVAIIVDHLISTSVYSYAFVYTKQKAFSMHKINLTQKNSKKFLGYVICTVYLLNCFELYGV